MEKVGRELDLIAVLLSDPAGGIAAAAHFNIVADSFGADDLRLMFVAAEGAAALKIERAAFLDALRRWLIEAGHWDDLETRAFHRGSLWGDAAFAEFADSFGAGPTPFIYWAFLGAAPALLDINARIANAGKHHRYAVALLEGRAE